MAEHQEIQYKDQAVSMRLDLFLSQNFESKGLTRSFWSNMIGSNLVLVNGSPIKNGYTLKANDQINIEWPSVSDSYSDMVTVIHEDDDILVLSKPAGMLTHSKGAFNPEYTIADFIVPGLQFDDESDADNTRAGIVHRLDRHTSGVLVTAKNQKSLESLQKQFASRDVVKAYISIVEGNVATDKVIIDIPLARNPKNPKSFMPNNKGKAATTVICPIRVVTDTRSLLLMLPRTGRTHQLRVHASHIKHPIVGDLLYDASEALENQRFLLHAYELRFHHPITGEACRFLAPIADDMSSYINENDYETIAQQIEHEATPGSY